MPNEAKKAVERYRQRAQRKGLVRVEVQVPREDVEAVRAVAGALRSSNRDLSHRTRRELLRVVQAASGQSRLKALLETAPFEDLELERSQDLPREVDFD